jgi:polyferredoxin
MSISDKQKVEVIYRRWIIMVPILMILIGSFIFYFIGSYNKAIGLIGGMVAFVGILTFGTLFSLMLGIELGARMLAKKAPSQSSFREIIEASEQSKEENQRNKS